MAAPQIYISLSFLAFLCSISISNAMLEINVIKKTSETNVIDFLIGLTLTFIYSKKTN